MSMIKVAQNIKGLIFDCDGTLVDSMPLHFEAWRKTFELFGREYPHEFVDKRKGMPIDEVIREYNLTFKDNINPEEFARLREQKAVERLDTVKAIKPVVEIVHRFHNVLPMAVCSGSVKEGVYASLKAVGLLEYFKVILTANDCLKPKPAPDIFLKAAQLMEIEAKYCQVFEDSDLGLIAAKTAGMHVTDIRKYI